MELVELVVIVAPILIGVPVLAAVGLSIYGVIRVSRWTWICFIAFGLLAFAPVASLIGYLASAPLPWRPRNSGLLISPIAFVLAILSVKHGARVTGRHLTPIRWAARLGATLLCLFAFSVWLFNLWAYRVHS
jgi:hypothetical protein